MRIIIGLAIIASGVLMIRHVDRVTDALGWSAFGNKFFGSSETYYKFLGFIVILIGMLITTGLIGSILLWLLGPLMGGFLQR